MPYIYYECCDVIDRRSAPEFGALKEDCWACGSIDNPTWLVELDEWNPAYRFVYNARIQSCNPDVTPPWRL